MSKLRDVIGESYKVIRGYIPAEEAIALGKDFIAATDKNGLRSGSNIVGEAYDDYNVPEHAAILSEKVPFINELLGEKVLPSYSFSRVYKNGSNLGKHKDRESCEISLSIHLYGDKEWAFCINNAEGEPVEVVLQPGDAILYDAPYATHWRPEYEGESYAQIFHHYVYLNGDYRHLLFDRNHETLSLREYIKVFDHAVPELICNEVINFVEKKNEWETATTVSPSSEIRVCESYGVKEEDPIDQTIFKYVQKAITDYNDLFKSWRPSEDSGYQILKYSPGGKYLEHCDQHKQYNREITLIINLNDEYEGGELHHVGGLIRTKMKKGDIIMFPSNFVYRHAITPITSGNRYSVVTWVV